MPEQSEHGRIGPSHAFRVAPAVEALAEEPAEDRRGRCQQPGARRGHGAAHSASAPMAMSSNWAAAPARSPAPSLTPACRRNVWWWSSAIRSCTAIWRSAFPVRRCCRAMRCICSSCCAAKAFIRLRRSSPACRCCSMKKAIQLRIGAQAFAVLEPGAPFIQFTYGLFSPLNRATASVSAARSRIACCRTCRRASVQPSSSSATTRQAHHAAKKDTRQCGLGLLILVDETAPDPAKAAAPRACADSMPCAWPR